MQVSLASGGGQRLSPAALEVEGISLEQPGECSAAVEAAGRSERAPESVGTKSAAAEQGSSDRLVKKYRVRSKIEVLVLGSIVVGLSFVHSSASSCSFCRHADTDVLSLAPLKRLALSVRVMPSETQTQPPCTVPLPMLVGEGLVVAITVEESVVLLPPAAAALMGEEQTTLVTAAPQATLEHQAGASSSNDNVLMVLVNQGASLPSPTRDREEAAAVASDTPAAAVVSSIGGTEDLFVQVPDHSRQQGHRP